MLGPLNKDKLQSNAPQEEVTKLIINTEIDILYGSVNSFRILYFNILAIF